ncbi:ATP-binding protein, partial [Streptomyces sp. 7R007]
MAGQEQSGDATTLIAEMRRVLARIDAHASRVKPDGPASDAPTSRVTPDGSDPGAPAVRVEPDGAASDAPEVRAEPDGPDGTASGAPEVRVGDGPASEALAGRVGPDGPAPGAPAARVGPDGPASGAGVVAVGVPGTGPLDALVSCFSLTPFERDLVLLAAAQELEPTTAARCAAACGDPERAYPTFSLALAALAEPHWSALTPVAPLRRWRIVELDDESRLTASRLRLDERILHFLLGSPYLDARLHGRLRRTPVPRTLPPSYDLAASRLAEGWTDGTGTSLVEVTGGDPRSRADIAAAAAARAG